MFVVVCAYCILLSRVDIVGPVSCCWLVFVCCSHILLLFVVDVCTYCLLRLVGAMLSLLFGVVEC